MLTTLIPVKSLSAVKNRLAPVLPPAARRALVGAMLADLLDACAAAPVLEHVVVISRDPEVQALAAHHEVDAWAEPVGDGLNGAVNWASARAVAEGARATLVITGDCPLTCAADLERVVAALPGQGVVYVPSADGTGTNAVFRRPGNRVPIAFGPGSLARHRRLARAAGWVPVIVSCPSIALDIDTPDDLLRLAEADSSQRSVMHARPWLAALHG